MNWNIVLNPYTFEKKIEKVIKTQELIKRQHSYLVKLYGSKDLIGTYYCKTVIEQEEIFEFNMYLLKNVKRILSYKKRRNK